jgi:CBS domain-containing protein
MPAVSHALSMPNQTTRIPPLAQVRVRDCMHPGVLTCGADDSLQDVAAIMANHRVHAVVITTSGADRAVGVVSDMDIVAAVAAGADCSAREAGATETLTVSIDEPLRAAAQLMNEHGVSHLVVVDGAGGYPLGILSTLDVATAFAGS